MVMTLTNVEEKSTGYPSGSNISGRYVEVVGTDALASAKKRKEGAGVGAANRFATPWVLVVWGTEKAREASQLEPVRGRQLIAMLVNGACNRNHRMTGTGKKLRFLELVNEWFFFLFTVCRLGWIISVGDAGTA
jgi:hypothetical protein